MVEKTVIGAVVRYLAGLPAFGIHASRLVLFGSLARDDADEWSDIDLVVIAPELDGPHELTVVEKLWLATASADNRIESIPCGEREWETEHGRPILDIARKEGIVITA
jgi:predicted nucleotidyltransferase